MIDYSFINKTLEDAKNALNDSDKVMKDAMAELPKKQKKYLSKTMGKFNKAVQSGNMEEATRIQKDMDNYAKSLKDG